jgi:hypothetical protein
MSDHVPELLLPSVRSAVQHGGGDDMHVGALFNRLRSFAKYTVVKHLISDDHVDFYLLFGNCPFSLFLR